MHFEQSQWLEVISVSVRLDVDGIVEKFYSVFYCTILYFFLYLFSCDKNYDKAPTKDFFGNDSQTEKREYILLT